MSVIAARESLVAFCWRRGYRPTGELTPIAFGEMPFGTVHRHGLYFIEMQKLLTMTPLYSKWKFCSNDTDAAAKKCVR